MKLKIVSIYKLWTVVVFSSISCSLHLLPFNNVGCHCYPHFTGKDTEALVENLADLHKIQQLVSDRATNQTQAI